MELVGFALIIGCVLFTIAWAVAALPILAVALFLAVSSGDVLPLIVWVVVSIVWLVLVKVLWPTRKGLPRPPLRPSGRRRELG